MYFAHMAHNFQARQLFHHMNWEPPNEDAPDDPFPYFYILTKFTSLHGALIPLFLAVDCSAMALVNGLTKNFNQLSSIFLLTYPALCTITLFGHSPCGFLMHLPVYNRSIW